MALAQRIAENSRLALRMTKFSINQAQDMMGYRTAVQGAHSNFMVVAAGGDGRMKDRPRLEGVDRALKREK
jgi:enoyl-CoA hydratase/carnithine racemase